MKPPFRVDRDAMLKVMKGLGIKRKVRVRWKDLSDNPLQPGMNYTGGTQHEDGDVHVITLHSAPIDADDANKSLLHELCHCRQREDLGIAADMTYTMYQHQYGYEHNPLELDAWTFAEVYAPVAKLVVAA